MSTQLTVDVLQYQKTGKGYRRIFERIIAIVYTFPLRRRDFNEDDCGDFLLFFYPRINYMIKRFEDTGRPFEVYLFTNLRYQLKTFYYRKRRKNHRENTLNNYEFWEEHNASLETRESVETNLWEDEFPINPDSIFSILSPRFYASQAAKRRLLLLLFKCAEGVNDHHIQLISIGCGYPYKWICRCIDQLRFRGQSRKERRSLLCKRRNHVYFFIRCYEEEYEITNYPERKKMLREKISEYRERFDYLQRHIRSIPCTATHSDIAEITGIPKGSVDSGLYYLRKHFREEAFKVGSKLALRGLFRYTEHNDDSISE